MNYSVSARQNNKTLQLADEIMVAYEDHNVILDYEELEFKDKNIVISIKHDDDVDWDFLYSLNDKFKLCLALDDLRMARQARDRELRFYFNFPVTTWSDVRGLVEFGVDEILIGAPLTFNVPKVRQMVDKNIKIRMYCNWSYENYIPRVNGINGSYVRPEDIPLYEPYVDTMLFYKSSLTQEAATLDVYKNGSWPGNLNLLIRNLDCDIDNRGIPEEFGKNRLNCEQKCMSGGSCHLCENIFKYVDMLDRNRFKWDSEKHDWIKDAEN